MEQIELKTGETYRGTLLESEDNWNLPTLWLSRQEAGLAARQLGAHRAAVKFGS